MSRDTGGAAFPLQAYEEWGGNEVPGVAGMSLRDYFAAKAMAQILNYEIDEIEGRIIEGDTSGNSIIARLSYEMADAMLAERAKP